MKNFSKLSLFSLIFIFSFLTFTSVTFAGNIPVGQACSPDNINQDRTCPYCSEKDGSRQVVFDWNFNWSDSRTPLCSVSCSIPSGTCDGALFRDENGYAGGTTFIKPTDKFVIFRDPKVGSTYQASCCVMNNGQCITTPVKSKKMTVTDCTSNACLENSFSSITDKLNANQNVLITEKDFDSWAQKDIKDYNSPMFPAGFGSGDVLNIKDQMEGYQCFSGVSHVIEDTSSEFNSIEFLKLNDSRKKAAPLVLKFFLDVSNLVTQASTSTPYYIKRGYHALIFLGINSHDQNYDRINIKLLDSNINTGSGESGIGIKDVSCERVYVKNTSLRVPPIPPEILVASTIPAYQFLSPKPESRAYSCNFGSDNGMPLRAIPMNLDKTPWNFEAISSNPIRQNTALWLRDSRNYPKIPNFSGQNEPFAEGGICAGWTLFILQTAYHGNFAGTDCHPDGTQSVVPKENFLASVFTSIVKLWSIFPTIDK